MPDPTTLPTLPPRLVPEGLPPGQQFLDLDSLEEGTLLERANKAFLHVMQEAIRRNAKGTLTLKVTVAPSREEGHESDFEVRSNIKIGLPEVKDARLYAPAPHAGAIVTDLRTVRKVLKPLGGGRYEDQHGHYCDGNGAVVSP